MKQTERGTGVCAERYVTGECTPWRIPGDEGHRGDFRAGVELVSSRSNGGANPALRKCRGILLQGGPLLIGGDLNPRIKGCQIPAGDRIA